MLHMGVSATRDQKRASCPLEMELQEIMTHMKHVFWDWNSGSFWEQQAFLLTKLLSLQPQ